MVNSYGLHYGSWYSKTGLGNRIAYIMIQKFGKRSLGIGYAITGLELILGALIPSNSARTGGSFGQLLNLFQKKATILSQMMLLVKRLVPTLTLLPFMPIFINGFVYYRCCS